MGRVIAQIGAVKVRGGWRWVMPNLLEQTLQLSGGVHAVSRRTFDCALSETRPHTETPVIEEVLLFPTCPSHTWDVLCLAS